MSKQIIISIDKNGMISAEVNGVKGPSCKDYISLIEELVAGKVISEELTSEFYQQEVDGDTQTKLSNDL